MKYPILSREATAQLTALPRKERHTELKSLVDWRGEGDDFDDSFVLDLVGRLSRLMKKVGGTPKKGTAKTMLLEAEASVLVHSVLKKYDPAITMDLDFWCYLAFSHLERFVAWRYGLADGPIPEKSANNFGSGSRQENFLFRLWCRSEMAYADSHIDPYYIARRGAIDFWRSHVLRQAYCNVRTFTRCFVLFQYPDEKKAERLAISEIRELAKRIKRLRTNVVFEILAEDQIGKLLEREASEIAV